MPDEKESSATEAVRHDRIASARLRHAPIRLALDSVVVTARPVPSLVPAMGVDVNRRPRRSTENEIRTTEKRKGPSQPKLSEPCDYRHAPRVSTALFGFPFSLSV
jgi:hypothetical protein